MEDKFIEEQIINFLISEGKISENDVEKVSAETDLINTGIIDSIGILELINYLEEKFHLDVENTDISAENFKNINVIIRLIKNI